MSVDKQTAQRVKMLSFLKFEIATNRIGSTVSKLGMKRTISQEDLAQVKDASESERSAEAELLQKLQNGFTTDELDRAIQKFTSARWKANEEWKKIYLISLHAEVRSDA
jgi:hypothetical protein